MKTPITIHILLLLSMVSSCVQRKESHADGEPISYITEERNDKFDDTELDERDPISYITEITEERNEAEKQSKAYISNIIMHCDDPSLREAVLQEIDCWQSFDSAYKDITIAICDIQCYQGTFVNTLIACVYCNAAVSRQQDLECLYYLIAENHESQFPSDSSMTETFVKKLIRYNNVPSRNKGTISDAAPFVNRLAEYVGDHYSYMKFYQGKGDGDGYDRLYDEAYQICQDVLSPRYAKWKGARMRLAQLLGEKMGSVYIENTAALEDALLEHASNIYVGPYQDFFDELEEE